MDAMEVPVAHPTLDGDGRLRFFLTLLLAGIALGGAIDLWLDWPNDPGALHLGVESGLLLLSLGGIAFLWSGWMQTRRTLSRSVEDSQQLTAERDAWRQRAEKLLLGLGEEIDAQLRRWSLTPAEREVALLLLKGFGHKEIASLLDRSERTVRQHAVAVYRKSNLGGRAQLAAFFLEDLLLPPAAPEAEPEQDEGREREQGQEQVAGSP
ncbi:MAG: LuxR C-terminal-related transcriptional regulator [Myxococcota bacterium]|nr:LuxR C-terminal-related transcriptional regulator [Myxococcota bacterium]